MVRSPAESRIGSPALPGFCRRPVPSSYSSKCASTSRMCLMSGTAASKARTSASMRARPQGLAASAARRRSLDHRRLGKVRVPRAVCADGLAVRESQQAGDLIGVEQVGGGTTMMTGGPLLTATSLAAAPVQGALRESSPRLLTSGRERRIDRDLIVHRRDTRRSPGSLLRFAALNPRPHAAAQCDLSVRGLDAYAVGIERCLALERLFESPLYVRGLDARLDADQVGD